MNVKMEDYFNKLIEIGEDVKLYILSLELHNN